MKQILVELRKDIPLGEQIFKIRESFETGTYRKLLLHVYSGLTDEDILAKVAADLKKEMPQADVVGTISAGEIKDGRLMERGILVSGMLFEQAEIQVHRIDHVKGHEAETGEQICREFNAIPDLKGIEFLLPGTELNTRALFEQIQKKCAPEVQVFGGYAGGHGLESPEHFVFDDTGILHNSVLMITYAGKDFHIDVDKSAGWQTLGMPFKVTKADENRLIEINGKPAVEVYEKYLQIDRNDNFAENTFEFPLMAKVNGEELLRHTIQVEEDGTLLLAGYVTEGMDIYLCYGNPSDIVEKVNSRLVEVSRFQPEAILLYSCSVRRSFWEDFVNMEMLPFESLAKTAGFHTWGEVRRDPNTGGLMEYNITLLSIAMREGEPQEDGTRQAEVDDTVLKGQASLLKRLTKLVYATTEELQKAYENMSFLNEQLKVMAEHDALTSMYNRGKIEELINEALDSSARTKQKVSLVMVDVDHFKQVNDTYGHDVGDAVLKTIAAILKASVSDLPKAETGRWGGEEFFILMPDTDEEEVFVFAENLRKQVSAYVFPEVNHLTVSMGVITTMGAEDRKGIYTNVDNALYQAKESGRNRVVKFQ